LYVATSGVQPSAPQGAFGGPMAGAPMVGGGIMRPYIAPGEAAVTQIHAFDVSDAAQARYLGSGTVIGGILNQWSMSEQDGVLRVASTTDDPTKTFEGGPAAGQSYVTTLAVQAGALTQLGRVGDLGKGQKIYGVRFIGDNGYVVTFRQLDPLYVLDLSDPAHPTVKGALEMPGYSAYLHPVGDHLLLGVGGSADDQGHRTGAQISLFDVSNPSSPRRIASVAIPNGFTATENTSLAFLWWQPASLAVIPMFDESGSRLAAYHVTASGIENAGAITHGDQWSSALRAMVAGDKVYGVFEGGIRTATLDGLTPLGWLEWPSPTPQTKPCCVAPMPEPAVRP
jgi:uncharacterized secreted protein with C-terminal beta-propeller domain